MATMKIRWVHIVPLIHLLVCLALSGSILPQLQWLGILFSILVIADFPISGVYIAIAVGKHGALAVGGLGVAGTLWWYFLYQTTERSSTALTFGWGTPKA